MSPKILGSSHILPLYLLIFSHIAADYFCQSKRSVRRKREKDVHLFSHAFLVLIFALFFFYPYWSEGTFFALVILSLFHLLVDKSKISLKEVRPETNQKLLNIADQLIHFLAMFLVWKVFFINLPWPFSFPSRPAFLNFLAVLIIILIAIEAVRGFVDSGEDDDSHVKARHDQ